MFSKQYQLNMNFYFFQSSQSWHYWHFCVISNENKLQIVANQTNLNKKWFDNLCHEENIYHLQEGPAKSDTISEA